MHRMERSHMRACAVSRMVFTRKNDGLARLQLLEMLIQIRVPAPKQHKSREGGKPQRGGEEAIYSPFLSAVIQAIQCLAAVGHVA